MSTKLISALAGAGVLMTSVGLSAAAYTPPPPAPACMEGNVTVPCDGPKWDLGLELLYVQQASEENWIIGRNVNTNANIRDWNQLKSKYAFGFKLEGSYHFELGRDVTLNWTHFNKRSTNDYENQTAANARTISSKTTFNSVNLEFGQATNFSEAFNTRTHFGLTYVQLKVDQNNHSAVTGVFVDSQDSRFRGFGLRTGQRLNYMIGGGFGAFGEWAVSALAGNIKSNAQQGANQAASASLRSITMGLETKIGLEYVHAMGAGDLSMYVAWQANTYQSAVQSYRNGADADLSTTNKPANHNWGYHGPSIGFKWVGNV